MRVGDVIDDRFETQAIAGRGGMGVVYRALDQSTGELVAVKLLHDEGSSADLAKRFAHEARLLGEIDHPHVVRYVAHGKAQTGEAYLVMEWLEGTSLSERLSRGPLSIEESIDLTRRVASALSAAHARGVVHRDLKPSNVFLPGGSSADIKLLDFGIAHLQHATNALTGTGMLLGTPGYMAPEQARGDGRAIDARADVFSLGCVLFECVTGKPAFQGVHVMALLAKLLMEEAPRLRDLRPEVPAFLDDLCASMLAKDPSRRPPDAAAVILALDRQESAAPSLRSRVAPIVTDAESRVVSVIAMGMAAPRAEGSSPDSTQLSTVPRDLLSTVRDASALFGGRVEELANGTLVALLVGTGPTTDQAATAARCALRLHALLRDVPIVLLTGRGVSTGRLPVGEVLESAASLLEKLSAEWGRGSGAACIRIDEVTRALLDARFDVIEQEGRLILRAEREVGAEVRTLLGKPSPFVGRDRELRNLLEILEESFDEEQAGVVLVTGAAGMGKSRLRYELVRKLREMRPDVAIVMGRGDSMGAGSAFAMLSASFRSSLGILAGEPLEEQRRKLGALVGRFLDERERRRVVSFLGEMIGAPFSDEDDPQLHAARQDASIMASRIERAYVDFVRAVTRASPALLVLEDLHWGDVPSVKLVDAALRELSDKPFVVVAFGRPEVESLFPNLWRERGVLEFRLSPLSRRSAENFSRAFLGEAGPGVISSIVDRAGGNAFYLEELIRAVSEGRGDSLPETVLGMVETRLSALSPEARRVLRAASIFGEEFWESGLVALLSEEAGFVRQALRDLCAREVLIFRPESRLSGETQYAFQHALVREAAYAMLTERDRAVGHHVAGEWLVKAGEPDPMVLAAHFERGGAGARAAEFYARAAEQAMRGGDLGAAIARAEKGLACGAEAEVVVALHQVLGLGHFLNADYPKSYVHSVAAVEAIEGDNPTSAVNMGTAVGAALFSGRMDAFGALVPRLMKIDPARSGVAATAQALYGVFITMLVAGKQDEARPFLERMEVIAAANPGDLLANAWTDWARVFWLRDAEQDPWRSHECGKRTLASFEAAGAREYIGITVAHTAWAAALLGLSSEARATLDRIILAARGEGKLSFTYASYFKSRLLLESRELEQAHDLARELVRALALGDPLMHWNASCVAIECLLLLDKPDEAERELASLGDPSLMVPYLQARHLSLRSEVQRSKGRLDEAVELAAEAVVRGKPGPRFNYGEDPLLLRHAIALHASGDLASARRVLAEARDDLLARAEKIPDLDVRRAFLENIPQNRRTLELSREWLG